ncbi:MAG: metal ABC transporter substrate-binding protein [Acidimicrobiales bacterium]
MHRTRCRILVLASLPILGVGVVACGDDDGTASGGTGDGLRVVASFYPLAEAAGRVGGDRVAVTNLTPAGTEPHDLELTPDQVDDLEDADLVLYLGQGFQPAITEIAERRDGETLDVLDGLELEPGGAEALDAQEGEHEEGGLDPHFWLDPRRMVDAVDEIATALSAVSPDDAATFAANAEDYAGQLTALDAEIEAALATCEREEIVTSHAAFFYLADRYGLTQLPLAGVSPEVEPDTERMDDLADLVDEHGITTVFHETLAPPDVAETLAREAGVDTAVLNPIEGLTEEQVDTGEDYASVMRENLAALVDALGCE